MSAIDNNPANKNFLSPIGFRFSIKRAPHINYFVQSVNLPDISIGSAAIPTPFSRIPLAGDRLLYGPLQLTFKVDEELQNYLEIHDWMVKLGFPDTFEEYAALGSTTSVADDGPYSDLSLILLSSSKNPVYEITFMEAYPTTLTDIIFDTKVQDVDYLECTATFEYRRFKFKRL